MINSEGIELSKTHSPKSYNYQSFRTGPENEVQLQPSTKTPRWTATVNFFGRRGLAAVALFAALASITISLTPKRLGTRCGSLRVFATTSDGTSQLSLLEGSSRISCGQQISPPMEGSVPQGPATAAVEIDLRTRRQSIIGFGGAFTEAAALTFAALPAFAQRKVLDLYWGEGGIGYTIGRVPINSCDFSVATYSFDDHAGDWNLDFFDMNVTHDQETMIPFMKRAISTAKASGLAPMKIFGSPWSPPAWLKAPLHGQHSMTGSQTPAGLANDPRSRMTWAKYLSKWATAYEGQLGIALWGMTVQNEPEFAAPWEACKYNATTEARFIREYLGPVLRAEHPDLKLMAFDHNKDHLEAWTAAMFPQPDDLASGASSASYDGEMVGLEGAGGFVDGMAFHWYAGGVDRLQDGTFGYHFLSRAHEMLEAHAKGTIETTKLKEVGPGGAEEHDDRDNSIASAPGAIPFLLGSEGCNCPGIAVAGTSMSWMRAERYAHDVLQDLNNWSNGWVDWNLILSSEGGPNHLGNVCDAPILANADFSDITVQPYLFVLGHFSRFLVPGTTIVSTRVTADFSTASPIHGGHSRIASGAALSLWPCDSSSRQRFAFNKNGDGKLSLNDVETKSDVGVADNDAGALLGLCVASANNAVAGYSAQVIDCDADEWVARFAPVDQKGRLTVLNPPEGGQFGDTPLCLTALPQYLELMSRSGGGPVALAPCDEEGYDKGSVDGENLSAFQRWNYDPSSHLLTSLAATHPAASVGHCITAGWPFVSAVAGVTPSGSAVAVVVNEASSEVAVALTLDDGTEVIGSLPPNSIETFIIG